MTERISPVYKDYVENCVSKHTCPDLYWGKIAEETVTQVMNDGSSTPFYSKWSFNGISKIATLTLLGKNSFAVKCQGFHRDTITPQLGIIHPLTNNYTLYVLFGSHQVRHQRDFPFSTENMQFIVIPLGTALLFDTRLVHGGTPARKLGEDESLILKNVTYTLRQLSQGSINCWRHLSTVTLVSHTLMQQTKIRLRIL